MISINYTAAKFPPLFSSKAGLHPLRLFYRHGSDATNLSLKYSCPGLAKQLVPLTGFSLRSKNSFLMSD